MKVFALILTLVLSQFMPSVASAKDLFGRTGIGYNAQFASTPDTGGVPGVSIKYGLAPRMMLEFIGGFYSGSGGSGVAALKLMPIFHSESYTHLYFLFGAGYVSANHRNGGEFLTGFGAEFFIPGIDRIGISFETGLSAESLTSTSRNYVLKTFGASFIHAGMHFYL